MLFDFAVPPAALALLCLVPAVAVWWTGRSLAARIDDPVLPERLAASRRLSLSILGFMLVVVVVFGGVRVMLWALPLIVLTRLVAGYPLRRALFDERWSLAAYLSAVLRLWLAAGFWVLVIAAPIVARASGSFDWVVSVALGTLLLAWNARYAETFRWLVRTKPLTDGPLLARVRAMAAASCAPVPRFEVVDLGGGALANALALASRRGSSVVYTDTLLRLLDEDEAAAITAHEIAHLEHFDAVRLGKMSAIAIALVVGGAAVAMLGRLAPREWDVLLPSALWSVISVVAIGWMARDRQRNETASDLRAVELSGDAEALVRALTKVYAFSRLPRRVDAEMERSASHPSLARRIRAIREAAGAAATPEMSEPQRVVGAGGKTIVTFENDRLHWRESEGVAHVLSYTHLTELRVQARATGRTALVAVERGGRRWEVALDTAEAARAQAILDRVDAGLAEPVARRPASTPLLQVAGAGVAICAMWLGHVLVALVALGASLRSAGAFFAAAGGGALGAAAIAARQALAGESRSGWPALLLAGFGIVLIAGAWRKREDEPNRVVVAGIAGLVVLLLTSLTLIAMRGGTAVGLNQASLAIPSGAVLPFALAAVFICRPNRRWRLAAIPIALVGVMVGVAGSGSFLYAFGRDPFLTTGPRLTIETLTSQPFADFKLPGAANDLRLSPNGRQVAVLRQAVAVGVATIFSVGAPGSTFAALSANDLVFLDDERVLTLSIDGVDSVIREVTLQPRAVVWEERIQNLQAPRLSYRAGTKRWLVTGTSIEGRLVSVEAALGSADLQRREWNTADRQDWADVWAIDGDTALLAERRFAFDPAGALGWTMLAMLDQMRTRLTRITPAGATELPASELDTSCADRVLDAPRLVCLAFDGMRTHLLTMAPNGAAPEPVGSVVGRFISHRPGRQGWLSGWVAASGWIDTALLAIDPQTGRAISASPELRAHELTAVGNVAGTLSYDASGTEVRLFRLTGRP